MAANTMSVIEQYPTPWVVGPYGCIWVAADVEFRDGKWHPTCDEPRIVISTGQRERELAEFIVQAINASSHVPELLGALENVRTIIVEGAMTGFNYRDGDWAERLFASQQVTSRAIKSASPAHIHEGRAPE